MATEKPDSALSGVTLRLPSKRACPMHDVHSGPQMESVHTWLMPTQRPHSRVWGNSVCSGLPGVEALKMVVKVVHCLPLELDFSTMPA